MAKGKAITRDEAWPSIIRSVRPSGRLSSVKRVQRKNRILRGAKKETK